MDLSPPPLNTYILIYLVDAKGFYKREILGFAICGPKGYFENWGVLWSVYMYIQSMHKDRIRSVL
jgi:hypothetical protein